MTPSTIVHYYLPDKEPFQNLFDLEASELESVAAELNKRKEEGLSNRGFPDWYFKQRVVAEQALRKAYIEKGGNPKRKSPHYFTLGRSIGFEWVYKENFKTIEIPIALVESELYFSIGDTLWTFAESHNPDAKWENKWYQGKLYNYRETLEILNELKVDLSCDSSINKHKIFCIETFIWSDTELKSLLSKASY